MRPCSSTTRPPRSTASKAAARKSIRPAVSWPMIHGVTEWYPSGIGLTEGSGSGGRSEATGSEAGVGATGCGAGVTVMALLLLVGCSTTLGGEAANDCPLLRELRLDGRDDLGRL